MTNRQLAKQEIIKVVAEMQEAILQDVHLEGGAISDLIVENMQDAERKIQHIAQSLKRQETN